MRTSSCFLLVVALAQQHGQPNHLSHHPDGSVMCYNDGDCSCVESTDTVYCDPSWHMCECRAELGKRQATTAPPAACDHGNVCTCSDGSTGHCSHDGNCHCHHR